MKIKNIFHFSTENLMEVISSKKKKARCILIKKKKKSSIKVNRWIKVHSCGIKRISF